MKLRNKIVIFLLIAVSVLGAYYLVKDNEYVPESIMSRFDRPVDESTMTILVHGWCRDVKNMEYMRSRLEKLDFNVVSVDLPTYFGTYQECLDAFSQQVDLIVKDYETINFVGHSMGGLIIRDYIAQEQLENVGKVVLIATPHKGSKLAEYLYKIPLYPQIFKSIPRLLPNNDDNLYIEKPYYQIGQIAGDLNVNILWRLLMPSDSDGKVTQDSAFTDDADEQIVFHYGHKFIHKNIEAVYLVANYLEYGNFFFVGYDREKVE